LIERYFHLVLKGERKSKVLIMNHKLTWTVVVQQLIYEKSRVSFYYGVTFSNIWL